MELPNFFEYVQPHRGLDLLDRPLISRSLLLNNLRSLNQILLCSKYCQCHFHCCCPFIAVLLSRYPATSVVTAAANELHQTGGWFSPFLCQFSLHSFIRHLSLLLSLCRNRLLVKCRHFHIYFFSFLSPLRYCRYLATSIAIKLNWQLVDCSHFYRFYSPSQHFVAVAGWLRCNSSCHSAAASVPWMTAGYLSPIL